MNKTQEKRYKTQKARGGGQDLLGTKLFHELGTNLNILKKEQDSRKKGTKLTKLQAQGSVDPPPL